MYSHTRTGGQADDSVGVSVKHFLDEQLLHLLVVLVDGHHRARTAGQDQARVGTDARQNLILFKFAKLILFFNKTTSLTQFYNEHYHHTIYTQTLRSSISTLSLSVLL